MYISQNKEDEMDIEELKGMGAGDPDKEELEAEIYGKKD